MESIRRAISLSIILISIALLQPISSVKAQGCFETNAPQPFIPGNDVTFTSDISSYGRSGGSYSMKFQCYGFPDEVGKNLTPSSGKITYTLSKNSCALNPDSQRYVELHWNNQTLCKDFYTVAKDPNDTGTTCNISISPSLPGTSSTIVANISIQGSDPLELYFAKEPWPTFGAWVEHEKGPVTKTVTLGQRGVGDYTVWLQRPTYSMDFGKNICSRSFGVAEKEGEVAYSATAEERLKNVCRSISNETTRTECENCFILHNAWTALGCIDTTQPTTTSKGFISALITLGASLAGGIAFLLILFGGFQIITSAGNPERLNAGRELVTSAIAGLLLIIFSIFLLKVIGVDILGIPGFG